LVALLLWFAAPLDARQIVTAIHVQWDNNLNDNQPWRCVTTGEVANPCFHFVVAYKFPITDVMVDWAELQELTQAHPVQPIRQTNFSVQIGLPAGCSQSPVNDPQNWSIQWCGMFPMMGPLLHNAPHRLTVQYRYLAIVGYNPMPVYETFGPFRTTVEFSVRNLVVSSSDEVKVLKWNPDRPEVCDTTFRYSLDSAQRRDVPVRTSIYSTDGAKVYEVTEQKACPQTHTFSWDGQTTSGQPAEPGLYVFDVEVNPNAGSSGDTDRLRSGRINIGEHKLEIHNLGCFTSRYILRSIRNAASAWSEVYAPTLERMAGPVFGPTHAIPPDVPPAPHDWCSLTTAVNLEYCSQQSYRFLLWARDSFSDQDKAHREKTCLTNQRVYLIGWFAGFGFHFSRGNFISGLPPMPSELDCRNMPGEIAHIVKEDVKRDPATGKLQVVPGYSPKVVLPGGQTGSLIFTNPIGASGFKMKLNEAVRGLSPRSGIVYYAGHGGFGTLIGFPDPAPESEDELFGLPTPGIRVTVTPFDLIHLDAVRVFYLSACQTCTDSSGSGLVAAIAARGAQAVVGFHRSLQGLKMPPGKDADKVFFRSLAGTKGVLFGLGAREGTTVGQALDLAWQHLIAGPPKRGQTWRDYYGVAGSAPNPLNVTIK